MKCTASATIASLSRSVTSCSSKLLKFPAANLLLRLVATLTLIELIISFAAHKQVLAARAKGLIYNRDGKFIFKPPRSGQGHIIVIDDRTPRERRLSSAANKTDTTGTRQDLHGFANNLDNFAYSNPSNYLSQIQLVDPSRVAAHSVNPFRGAPIPVAGGPIQLIGLNDFQAARNGQTSLAASSQFAPQISPTDPRRLAPTSFVAAGGAGHQAYQMIPMFPIYAPNAAPAGGQTPTIGYNVLQPTQSISLASGYDLQADQQQQQQQGLAAPASLDVGGGAAGLTFSRPSFMSLGHHSPRMTSFEQDAQSALGAIYDNGPITFDSNSPAGLQQSLGGGGAEVATFEESPSPPSSSSSSSSSSLGHQRGSMQHHQSAYVSQMRPRHNQPASSAASDLDRLEDVDGEHLDYYEGRTYRSRVRAPPAPARLRDEPQLSRLTIDRQGPPPSLGSAHVPGALQTDQRTGMDPPPSQSALPLAQSNPIERGLVGGGGGLAGGKQGARHSKKSAKPRPTGADKNRFNSFSAPNDQLMVDGQPMAESKDPASSNYWRQYKDQFDMIQ